LIADVQESLTWHRLLLEVQIPDEDVPATPTAWDSADTITEIYISHYNQLVRLSVMLIHDVQSAEEVVQQAFEAMHLAWKDLGDSNKAVKYLLRTVVSKSRSLRRRRKIIGLRVPKPASIEPNAENLTLTMIERSAVAAALRSLPSRQREAIVLRYYADLSDADIAAAMGISRGAVKSNTVQAMAKLKSILDSADEAYRQTTVTLPVTVYLADEGIHTQVEAAVEKWLATAGISIVEREKPVIGSWFRRMRAVARTAMNSETAQDMAMTAVHAADARLILAQDANNTAILLSNLGSVLAALQPTKDAALRVGALLIVKIDWAVQVIQLTAAQQAILDHQPQLASSPQGIIAALQLPNPTTEHATPAVELR
jgi:RNA polymerase sigma-70 factor (sigma-E family)